MSVAVGIPQTKVEEDVFDANDVTQSGRVITAFYPDFILVACFKPPWGGKDLKNGDYKRDYEAVFYKYLLTLDSSLPIVLCGDLNDTPGEKSSYFKTTILPVRDFVDSYTHIQILPSPASSPAAPAVKRQKTKGKKVAKSKINISPGSTYYAEDNAQSALPLVDPLDRTDTNGVRYRHLFLFAESTSSTWIRELVPHLSSSTSIIRDVQSRI